MAIGVGDVNNDELQGVATSSSYVHTVNDFSALASIQQQLVSIACEREHRERERGGERDKEIERDRERERQREKERET